jgi:ATP-dependent RNA circularization protein (DNA/RNA ligase family)
MIPCNANIKLLQLSFDFFDVDENLVIIADVVTPSNPIVKEEELEEASIDINVSQ